MAVLFQEIIRKKRDGDKLTTKEINEFVAGITDGSASDAHISALAMAVFFQGLDREETVALTMAMRDSGDVLAWSESIGKHALVLNKEEKNNAEVKSKLRCTEKSLNRSLSLSKSLASGDCPIPKQLFALD